MPVGDLVGGRYRLESRIAQGGMGAVWNGTDTRLGRKVAIKVLHPGLSGDEAFRVRFASEATLIASLNTRSIATVHDYGEDESEDGTRAYLVMELVHGRSLADILRHDGTPGVAEAMRIVAEAAEGLHAAHVQGIVHRDVKPANILITDDGSVKLIDFGIARALGDAGLTETGMVIGTVAYTAPEQLADEDPAPAADVYSLGIVAYECLTGATPFGSGKVPAIINGHLNQAPPPFGEDVPRAVSDAVMTALRKDPDDRWRTAERFARACREALDGITPDAPPPSSFAAVMSALIRERPETAEETPEDETRELPEDENPPPAPKPRRRPVPVLSACAVALLLLALVIFRPWDGTGGGTPVRDHVIPPLSSLFPGGSADPSGEPQTDESGDGKSPDGKDEDRPGTPGTGDPDDGNGDQDGGGDDDPTTAKVPDLTDVPVEDAPGRLRSSGFENSEGTAEMDWQGTPCVVISQSPEPGKVVDLGTRITYQYIENYPPCADNALNPATAPDAVDPTFAAILPVSRDRAAVARRTGTRRTRR